MDDRVASRGSPDILVDRVSKTFQVDGRTVAALQEVSLVVPPGQFLCLVGRAAVASLLSSSSSADLQRPSSGAIYLGGQRVTGPTPEAGLGSFSAWRSFPGSPSKVTPPVRPRGPRTPQGRPGAAARPRRASWPAGRRAFLPRPALGRHGPSEWLSPEPSPPSPERSSSTSPWPPSTPSPGSALQAEIEALWRRERLTALFVTHDIEEAVYLGSRVAVMAPSPGRVQRIVDVDLPRPRSWDEPRFLQLCATIFQELHHEAGALRATSPSEPSVRAEPPADLNR